MRDAFGYSDILMPKNPDLQKWAVIACDQFTSDKKYWERVDDFTGAEHSTLHMIFPEIYLENNPEKRIKKINQTMCAYIDADLFTEYADSFVYVERTLIDGSVRPGIVGAVDLEQYHYDPSQKPKIGATEQTVLERVPPRIAVRRNAALEFSHVILFYNDVLDKIMNTLKSMKDRLPKIYDFMLMEDGGHISGWLISGENAMHLQEQIHQYIDGQNGVAFLVADGNHSLATAKCWYEELKEKYPEEDLSNHPARYAMVELENIQDPSICFEAIHRVVFNTDPEKLFVDIQSICTENGCPITLLCGDRKQTVFVNVPEGTLPIAVVQDFLDDWLSENSGKIDYVHDVDAVERFALEDNTVGLILPSFDKSELFAFGAAGHVLPRKTFSLGHAREKRYYLEGRKIR